MKIENRTLELFGLFAREQQAFSLAEIARGLRVPMSSCFYLVRCLEDMGFLYIVDRSRHIYATRKLYDIASAIVSGERWMKRCEARLEKLRVVTQETIILAKRQRLQVVYLSVLEGPQQIRYTARVGDLKPLHSSATGKALLSGLPAGEREDLVWKLKLEPKTKTTITDRKGLLQALEQCVQSGYAITLGENVVDVAALAMPLRLNGGLYALAIAGPMHRMIRRMEEHKKRLTAVSEELQEEQ